MLFIWVVSWELVWAADVCWGGAGAMSSCGGARFSGSPFFGEPVFRGWGEPVSGTGRVGEGGVRFSGTGWNVFGRTGKLSTSSWDKNNE